MPKQIITRKEEIKPVIPLSQKCQLELSRPLIMGILNVTPDSFSDGGNFVSFNDAVKRAKEIEQEGADIIDIGGESSRPGADAVSLNDELKRVIPVIESIRKHSQIPISIDTYKAETAQKAIEAGANIVNDISALRFDNKMAEIIANAKVPVILMHMLGTPQNMQMNPTYKDCVNEIKSFFEERINFCIEAGIDKSKIILDPGIGFGKRLSDNLEILQKLNILKKINLPLLIGTSRKSFINMIDPSGEPAYNRIGGSIASAVLAVQNGANIIRVHDVKETVEALKITMAIKDIK